MLSATLGAVSPYIRFLLLSSLCSHCTWSSFISLDFLVIWCLGGYGVRELFWIFSRGFCCILSQQRHMHYPLRESAYLCQGWQRFQLARPLGRLKHLLTEVGLIRAGVELRMDEFVPSSTCFISGKSRPNPALTPPGRFSSAETSGTALSLKLLTAFGAAMLN